MIMLWRRIICRTSAALRAERHPDPDLARPLRDAVGNHAVDPDRRQDERDGGETAQQHRIEPWLRECPADHFLQRHQLRDKNIAIQPLDDAPQRRLRAGRDCAAEVRKTSGMTRSGFCSSGR